MNQNFSMKIMKENKVLKSKTIRLTPKKGDTINFKDIKTFYNKLIERGTAKPEQIQMVGMSPDKMRYLNSTDRKKGFLTLKRMNDDFKNLDDDEYYKDSARDPVKFDKFFFIDFIILPN